MKSLDYHSSNEATTYRSFFIGLHLFYALFTLIFYTQAKYMAFAILSGTLVIAHFYYWFNRQRFDCFAANWIKLSTAISHFMTPLILNLFYFIILTPYGLIFRLIEKRKGTTWHESESELRFKDPF